MDKEVTPAKESGKDNIGIGLIIAITIISLACIASCTWVTIVFLSHAPW